MNKELNNKFSLKNDSSYKITITSGEDTGNLLNRIHNIAVRKSTHLTQIYDKELLLLTTNIIIKRKK